MKNSSEGNRRLHPKIWHHDGYALLKLRQTVEQIIRLSKPTASKNKIIDLGCGNCPYKPLFLSYNYEYTGCDIEGNADVIIDVGKPIPLPDQSCDLVVSFQVLEHVWDIDWYLGECHRLLKPNGLLLLSTHGIWPYHPHPTDFRRWTREGLIQEIKSRGFVMQQIIPLIGPLAVTTLFRLLGCHVILKKLGFFGGIVSLPIACLMNLKIIVEDWMTPQSIRETNASIYVTLSQKGSRPVT